MGPEPIKVRMLGEFTLCRGGTEIRDSSNRSRKVWLVLAYLICCRGRPVPQEELIRVLWEEDEGSSNPVNALKTTLHRARQALDRLDGQAGQELLLRRDGSLIWNTGVPLTLDLDEFERGCREGSDAADPAEKLDRWLSALALYRGPFLARLSSEPWVAARSADCHSLYLQTLHAALPLLKERARWADVQSLCAAAVRLEPDREPLFLDLMTAYIRQGMQREAVAVYEELTARQLSQSGAMPSPALAALYHEALHLVDERAVSFDMVLDYLREPDGPGGALLCDYDFFRTVYHTFARMVQRSGGAVHLALICIGKPELSSPSQRSVSRALNNLKDIIRSQLRRGDVFARCSASQFVLLLPQASYENACMVCERIVKAYRRQYPHAPVEVSSSVRALEPNPGRKPASPE